MKKYLLPGFAFTLLLIACNDNKETTTSTTSSDSSTNNSTVSTPAPETPATNMGNSASLMDMMNKNMQEMKAMTSSGNPDNDFASMMKTHHMGALEMAQAEVAQGTNAEMKAMAQKMIDEQQKEIAELNTFLSGHQAHGGGDAFHKEVMAQMNNMKMDMSHSGSFDKQFAEMMIPHHQGAIDMSKAYIKSGAHEEKLKTMANKIIADQQKEIGELQAWLSKNQ